MLRAMSSLVPWFLAAAAAVWFGWMAQRSGRNLLLWGLGGAVFALVTTTIIFGLGHAAAIPFSDQESHTLHYEWAALSAAVIVAFGWLVTTPLHRHLLRLWQRKA
jgi:hypothetical protein